MTGIYEAHLTAFLAAAEDPDLARRVEVAAQAYNEIRDMTEAWKALLRLSIAELHYERRVKQDDIAPLLGDTRQMVSIHATEGRNDAVRLKRDRDKVLREARRRTRRV